ncbi:arsenate reductase and related [Parvibaculum lavamentivorans DS-1]|uniref:Arsenate reductase and related n=1 Tax=Parvibaculum lavamentivorans (strain DS-1 / DSM 13023 / NCIMB 13966) TaxID=402881 RepID=A7HTM8_PARL1|nr:arsenate reductase [Parvibaculum lavamentivorans]ABS63261.1 arsenate reductase and related [Parvibaculum lavamentivorans DS-1]
MLTVYGLKNCDTCRKALKWLDAEGVPHRFHDLRADGIKASDIKRFAAAAGWDVLLNKSSTTWRSLPKSESENVGEAKALALMAAHPALIKRPVFELENGAVVVGFREEQKTALKAAGRK